ncbi:MAG: hypothetical protein ACREBT_02655 [Thermoplasmata archaeon]
MRFGRHRDGEMGRRKYRVFRIGPFLMRERAPETPLASRGPASAAILMVPVCDGCGRDDPTTGEVLFWKSKATWKLCSTCRWSISEQTLLERRGDPHAKRR